MSLADTIKKKKSKRAFTLVELVIVITILSILASIAIPVITATINSSKISTLESNSATVDMLIKEAVNTSRAGIDVIKYNGKNLSSATVADVLLENNIAPEVFNVQKIGGVQYAISWDNMIQGTVIISGPSITAYNVSTGICSLN